MTASISGSNSSTIKRRISLEREKEKDEQTIIERQIGDGLSVFYLPAQLSPTSRQLVRRSKYLFLMLNLSKWTFTVIKTLNHALQPSCS